MLGYPRQVSHVSHLLICAASHYHSSTSSCYCVTDIYSATQVLFFCLDFSRFYASLFYKSKIWYQTAALQGKMSANYSV